MLATGPGVCGTVMLAVPVQPNASVTKTEYVPLAEMLKYSSALNSLTGGRATYSMDFLTYEEVPRELAARILEEQKLAKAATPAH